MFYTNEEIQVIGINIENINLNDEIEIKQKFSKLNEDLRLKNRYKKVCEENDELKKKIGKEVKIMNKIKMTKEEFDKRALEVMMRSCWNCNSAHKHLKKANYIIWCFVCGKLYLNGKEIEIVGEDNE